ncbi:MAG TPA: ATPase P [Lachnospiraceae bacterium]|nr:ATPase P [Lachnospiraceae bacterium]
MRKKYREEKEWLDADMEEEDRIPTTRYQPDYREGLTQDQVQEHKLHGWTNKAVEPPSKSVKEIIHDNVFTYFNLIFLILAVLLCVAGSFRNLTFLPVIFLNTMIGIIQEIRAKNVLDRMNMLNAPRAMVVRDGKVRTIDAEELVLDDIVLFKAGGQVCADAVVCDGEVRVNESLLTGESDEIVKKEGDHLMSGSYIVSGECYGRLERIGADSYISQLTLQAKEMPEGEQSEMIRSLNKLVKSVGIIIIPIGILLFGQAFFFQKEGLRSSIISMVAAVIGMIPEGLYLLASVAMAVSSMRLAKKKVLLHDMKCIETLARVNVLCVDKTGTITENVIKVQEVVPTEHYDAENMAPLMELISDFTAAMSQDNNTMKAMKEYFCQKSKKKPSARIGFSSALKYSSVTFEEESYILGAPEFVLLDTYEEYADKIAEYASKGMRVLVFGTAQEQPEAAPLKEAITPLCFILMANPVRKEAKETFRYFAEQGVEIKVISGDNPLTVSEAALQAGIEGADQYIDAALLETEEEIRTALQEKTVFGRVTPAQKRLFVQLLKEEGNTVAMTGDGVNDILALKDADCSIAMASGSEAAAQASQLVLLESDFSKMPQVVQEGRRVVNNIQRSASLFLVKNIFSFLLSLFSVIFMITYPLEPSQVSLISMFTIGIPAFFLALEPNHNLIQGHFLTNVLLKALPAGLTDVIAVGALVVFGQTFGVNDTDISTAATMLLAFVGFMILCRISAPMNPLRITVICGCIAGLLFCSIFLHQLFAITGMSGECIMLFTVFFIATEPVLRYLTIIVEKISGFRQRHRQKKAEN